MKTQTILIGLSLALAACDGAPEAADPYAELGEDSLLVRFEANPNIAEDQCNPNVHYAMRTTEESILLNVNFVFSHRLLLHWTSQDDYTVALLTSWGGLRVDRRKNGRWISLERFGRRQRPGRGAIDLEARREGAFVRFLVDGTSMGRWKLPGRTLGLALERGDLRFSAVRWE